MKISTITCLLIQIKQGESEGSFRGWLKSWQFGLVTIARKHTVLAQFGVAAVVVVVVVSYMLTWKSLPNLTFEK